VAGALASGILVAAASVDAIAPRAQPDEPTITYSLSAPTSARVCLGGDTSVTVSVERLVQAPGTAMVHGGLASHMDSVVVESEISDPRIISTPNAVEITGWNGSQPPTATFRVHGEQVGEATLTLTAKVAAMADLEGWQGVLEDQRRAVAVTVVDCPYKVSVRSRWVVPGPANIEIGATFIDAALMAEGDGTFKGVAHVTWYFALGIVGDCMGTLSAERADAALSATTSQTGELTVEVFFDPVTVLMSETCVGADGGVATGNPVQELQPDVVQFVYRFPGRTAYGTVPQGVSPEGVGEARWVVVPAREAQQ
jgi:hypothetical protein